jgi:hypothetical protein
LRLICPSCGATHSAEAWSSDADARQCIRIVGELPWDISRRVLAYLALFRPHAKGLRWSTALRLLHELSGLVAETHIQWQGKPARPCNTVAWALAMERVIENPPKRLPLKNHNYLRAVAWEVADELDKTAERKHVALEQSGGLRSAADPASPNGYAVGTRIDQETMRKITEQNFRGRKK